MKKKCVEISMKTVGACREWSKGSHRNYRAAKALNVNTQLSFQTPRSMDTQPMLQP